MTDPSAHSNVSFGSASEQGPHPLAVQLAEVLRGWQNEPRIVAEIGSGSGRNLEALTASGWRVVAVEADPELRAGLLRAGADPPGVEVRAGTPTQLPLGRGACSAALSTHALLHGNVPKVCAALAEIARVLVPGGPLFCVLASTADARYGAGQALDDDTFAPLEGPERGVPHAFFSERTARDALRAFTIDALEAVDADGTAGRWAHRADERGKRHWFVRARYKGAASG